MSGTQITLDVVKNIEDRVAVGISVTRYSRHRSVRALLTHTAPTESMKV